MLCRLDTGVAHPDTVTQGEVIALDGKSVRRSFDTASGQGALHLVSAWAGENRLVLGQQAVDEKSNEMKAVPALLQRLDIRGCIVTTDALNTLEHAEEYCRADSLSSSRWRLCAGPQRQSWLAV